MKCSERNKKFWNYFLPGIYNKTSDISIIKNNNNLNQNNTGLRSGLANNNTLNQNNLDIIIIKFF